MPVFEDLRATPDVLVLWTTPSLHAFFVPRAKRQGPHPVNLNGGFFFRWSVWMEELAFSAIRRIPTIPTMAIKNCGKAGKTVLLWNLRWNHRRMRIGTKDIAVLYVAPFLELEAAPSHQMIFQVLTESRWVGLVLAVLMAAPVPEPTIDSIAKTTRQVMPARIPIVDFLSFVNLVIHSGGSHCVERASGRTRGEPTKSARTTTTE